MKPTISFLFSFPVFNGGIRFGSSFSSDPFVKVDLPNQYYSVFGSSTDSLMGGINKIIFAPSKHPDMEKVHELDRMSIRSHPHKILESSYDLEIMGDLGIDAWYLGSAEYNNSFEFPVSQLSVVSTYQEGFVCDHFVVPSMKQHQVYKYSDYVVLTSWDGESDFVFGTNSGDVRQLISEAEEEMKVLRQLGEFS